MKNCKVYREDVPQNFTVPCFMVTLYDQNLSRGINGRLKNTVNLDVLYFPENRNRAEKRLVFYRTVLRQLWRMV